MKKLSTLILIVALGILPALSFAQEKDGTWKQQNDFHTIMAATFHPAEDGNLAPLKEKAEALYASAQSWSTSPVPMNYKELDTKKALKELVIQTYKIEKAIGGNSSDAELTRMLTEAHDTYHHIVGECKKG